jgi:hypothetical protein
MKISRFVSLTAALLYLTGLLAFGADAAAPNAAPAAGPADTQAQATAPQAQTEQGEVYFQITNATNVAVRYITIPYKQGMTLMQTIKDDKRFGWEGINKVQLGQSGGTIFSGDSGFGSSISNVFNEASFTAINYAAIENGEAQDTPLAPGDLVKIQTAYVYFEVGYESGGAFSQDFNQVFYAAVPYKLGMTLGQVVNLQKDKIKWADLGNVSLSHVLPPSLNRSGGRASLSPKTPVNYAAIASGQAKDIPLEVGDTVYVGLKPFVFDGGTPGQVIKAVQDFFGVDLSTASIPSEMADAQVPKFRIDVPTQADDVLQVYNRLGAKIPALGQWLLDINDPNGNNLLNASTPMVLIPDKSVAAANAEKKEVKARAISIAAIPAAKWPELQNEIMRADALARQYVQQTGGAAVDRGGTVQLQDESQILIVIGVPSFIELADSIVAAYEKNAQTAHAQQLYDAGLAPAPAGTK